MAQLITVDEPLAIQGHYCKELESGNILFFPQCPFEFPSDELSFLLAQKQTGAANRKNIAYKPHVDRITNFVRSSVEQEERLLTIMRNYSQRVQSYLSKLLAPYADEWQLDYASFRPFQEKGRKLRTRARNDLLHVDAFPTRPLHGSRILRFFTNINPTESRNWITSSPFEELLEQFGHKVSYPQKNLLTQLAHQVKRVGYKLGLPVTDRSPYDTFMLNLHNSLKENPTFQKECPKDYWQFPPHCCWAVFTDQVSHAAIAGQYALEQTIRVPVSALVEPHRSPLAKLEAWTGRAMVVRQQVKKKGGQCE